MRHGGARAERTPLGPAAAISPTDLRDSGRWAVFRCERELALPAPGVPYPVQRSEVSVRGRRARPRVHSPSMARRQTSDFSGLVRATTRRPEHLTEQRSRPPIVEMRRVTKVYPGGHVGLEHVSLRVDRGEFVFLVGPTGCGKTTLIKTLIRELQPHRGRGADRRPRHRLALQQEGATAAPPDRHRLPGLQAAAEPDRLRQRRLRAAGDRRLALGDPQEGAGRSAPGRPCRQGEELSPTSSRAESSSASRSPVPSSTTRRCCSPTSRPATSTPTPPSGSCRCSTGSTAPGRPSSW